MGSPVDYKAMFRLIDDAEKHLAANPGGGKNPEALQGFKSFAAQMLVASCHNGTVDQKAASMEEWASMLYRSRAPKGYTFEHLRTLIGGELYSMRIALQILQGAQRRRSTAPATRPSTRKEPRK